MDGMHAEFSIKYLTSIFAVSTVKIKRRRRHPDSMNHTPINIIWSYVVPRLEGTVKQDWIGIFKLKASNQALAVQLTEVVVSNASNLMWVSTSPLNYAQLSCQESIYPFSYPQHRQPTLCSASLLFLPLSDSDFSQRLNTELQYNGRMPPLTCSLSEDKVLILHLLFGLGEVGFVRQWSDLVCSTFVGKNASLVVV